MNYYPCKTASSQYEANLMFIFCFKFDKKKLTATIYCMFQGQPRTSEKFWPLEHSPINYLPFTSIIMFSCFLVLGLLRQAWKLIAAPFMMLTYNTVTFLMRELYECSLKILLFLISINDGR